MYTGVFSGPSAAWELLHQADSVESPWAEVLRAEERAVMTAGLSGSVCQALGRLMSILQIFLQRRRNKPSSLQSNLAKSTCTYVYGACMIHSWGATLVSCYIYFSLCVLVYAWARVCHMMSEEDIFRYIPATWAASVGARNGSEAPWKSSRCLSHWAIASL